MALTRAVGVRSVVTHDRSGPSGGDRALQAAYEHCRRIHAEYGRTYYLATLLLPRERRPHVWALYAFARFADQFVDDPASPDPTALVAWGDDALRRLYADTPPHPLEAPIVAATWHTLRHYQLPVSLLEEFLASMRMDLTVARYPTWTDLRGYMRGSAAVIGELMVPILGGHGEETTLRGGLLGEAFQLTNFVRDIAEDFRLGRIYLPLEDLAHHGVEEAELAAAVDGAPPGPRVRALVAFEAERALDLYEQARPGLAMVDAVSRPCVEAAFTLYRGILGQVARADYDVFSVRATVPQWQRAATVARVLCGSGPRRLRAALS